MKKIFKRILLILMITLTLTTVNCFAADEEEKLDVKEIIKNEEGSLFDKTIAKTIGGLAQAVYNIATDEEVDIGFKTYEDMIFKGGSGTSPFSSFQWNLIMAWYKVFAYISGSLILIAVVILSYKMIISSMSTARRNEVKENLLHLAFGGVFIATAPIFIKFLLFLNNSMVNILVRMVADRNVDSLMGNEFLSSITTGNPIATALVISMFIYIFVKLNIKFIVREFTIIVFTIFTPIVTGLWVINKNVTAAAIWGGQIMINIFMQFIYCFLFLLFSSFISASAGWAVTLIWAMMLLPIADVLMNCLQNLTSRIAGLDSNESTMRGIGLGSAFGSAIGYSVGAIKTQFTGTNSNNGNGEQGNNTSFMGRVKNLINPQMNLSAEKDYNGNINPIRSVVDIPKTNNTSNNVSNTSNIQNVKMNNNQTNMTGNSSVPKRIINTAYQGTKAYLAVGAKMAEGNFDRKNHNNTYGKEVNINRNNTIVEKTLNEKIDSEKESDADEI